MKRFVVLAVLVCSVILPAAAQTGSNATRSVTPGRFTGEIAGETSGQVQSVDEQNGQTPQQIDPRRANAIRTTTPSIGAVQTAPAASGPSQAERDAARREADAARIRQGTDEARAQADERMNAASTSLAIGMVSGTSGIATQRPAQQSQDIETLTQRTLTQTGQDANADLRGGMSQVQRENQRQQALREHTQCLRNAANASQCPCPNGTQQVNGQCVAAGN